MPKHKTQRDSTSDSDSGPDDRGPVKKGKTESKKQETGKSKDSSTAETEDYSWSLGKSRFVKLREFKNKWYVDIREHYQDDSEMRPGKKGLMLTMEQWQKLKACIGEVDEAIKKNV